MNDREDSEEVAKWLEQRVGIKRSSVTEKIVVHRIVILVEPVPVSYYKTRWGIAPTNETVKFQREVRKWLRTKTNLVTDNKIPLTVKVWFYFRPPMWAAKLPILPPHVEKPDFDNLSKSFLDCLKPFYKRVNRIKTLIQEGVIPDDKQINHSQIWKAYTRKTPRIVVKIEHKNPPEKLVQANLI